MTETSLKKRIILQEKVTEIAKMIVRMVAFEGLQPLVTEAFLKQDNILCGLDTVKKSNEEWTFGIIRSMCSTLLVSQQ